jgi:hypothetical protein
LNQEQSSYTNRQLTSGRQSIKFKDLKTLSIYNGPVQRAKTRFQLLLPALSWKRPFLTAFSLKHPPFPAPVILLSWFAPVGVVEKQIPPPGPGLLDIAIVIYINIFIVKKPQVTQSAPS